jgi:aspartyl-tRNA(Asn)/glutamyl-tRNA(Gln) amidotransferase subunit A
VSQELAWLSIDRAASLIARREISPRELLESLFCRIQEHGAKVNAFITIDFDGSRGAAKRAESEILRGRYRGPLHGIPVALKDNIWTARLRTTAGSRILADFVPAKDATVVRRLRQAGAVLIGKTNMSEFAYGATNNNQHYGATHNPWNLDRTTGGSSGGSAAAVAAGFAFAALGTDTGGSIRIPAALCGVVGLKATFGRVSCHGTIPLVPAHDHVGPIARSVADVAMVLTAIAGRDRWDPTTAVAPVPDFVHELGTPAGRFRLGRPREYYFDRLSSEVAHGLETVARAFEQAGAEICEVHLPSLQEATERCVPFAYAEATRVHRRLGYFPARAAEYGDDVRERLELGDRVSAADYDAAAEAERVLKEQFAAVLRTVDAVMTPTVPVDAPVIGQKTVVIRGEEEAVRSALIRLNRPASIVGLPAITVPCGFTSAKLPFGVQLIGRAFGEVELLRIAQAYARSSSPEALRPAGLLPSSTLDAEPFTQGTGQ